jgi:hypothetical protein
MMCFVDDNNGDDKDEDDDNDDEDDKYKIFNLINAGENIFTTLLLLRLINAGLS